MKSLTKLGISVIAFSAMAFSAKADLIQLNGFGSDSGLPLSASIDVQIIDPYTLTMKLTNTAITAGTDNRITYFGFQMPTSGMSVSVNPISDSAWSLNYNDKLPGGGANTFNYLFKTTQVGTSAGLNIGQSLVLNVTSTQADFNTFTTANWTPTSKNGYLWATKFQSVGPGGEDSGIASTNVTSTITYDPDGSAVPEPATLMLMAASGTLLLMGRKRRTRES